MHRCYALPSLALIVFAACGEEPNTTPQKRSSSSGGTSGSTNSSGGNGDGGVGSSSGDTPPPSGPPAVAFVGRLDTKTEPAAPRAAWPGVRIMVRFEGTTSVSAKLGEMLEGEGPSEWDVVVDDKVTKKLVLQGGERDYELASGLSAGIHVVELYRRSEAQNGVTRFLGFDLNGGTMLSPPGRPPRHIEIIGDSAASAFGIEGVGQGPDCPGEDWAARWQNFRLSWGANLGVIFNADVHGTVFSGKGFAKNIWRPDKETLPRLYDRSNPNDADSKYDLASWVPDAVVIMAGGNDFAEGQGNDDTGPASLEDFVSAYDGLVGTLRTAYPKAHLFLTVSTSLRDDEPAGRDTRTNVKKGIQRIVSSRSAKGDTRVYLEEPAPATESELTGCNGHGNPEHQKRVANELAKDIKAKLSW